MKLKKILASLTAAAMAVTTMAFAPVSVSAAAVDSAPEGTETVIASIDNYKSTTVTGHWQDLGCANSNWSVDISSYMKDPNCYVKFVASVTESESAKLSDLTNWACAAKWYVDNKSDTTNNYAVEFIGTDDSTLDNFVSYAPLADFKLVMSDGTAHAASMQGNVQTGFAGSVTIKEFSIVKVDATPAPFEGDVFELVENNYTGGSNWQKAEAISQTLFTKNMPMTEVFKKASTVKISFKVNGVAAGTNTSYDPTQIKWSINLKFHNGDEWPWIVGGTSSYENGVVTISADLASIVDEKYNSADYLFDSVNLVGAADKSTSTDTIKVYYEDMKVSVEKTIPATSITVAPATAELKVGETTTVTAAALPVDTTDEIVFTTSDESVATVEHTGVGVYTITAIAPGTATITATAGTVSADCEVTVLPNTHTVTVSSNDTAMGTAKADVAEAAEGDTVTLTAEPAEGYKFVKWETTGVTLAEDDVTSETASFEMPASDVTAKAVFEEIPAGEHAVTVKTAEGGTASASPKSAVRETEITLTVKPAAGYEFDKWIVSPETVVITDNKFTMPDEAVTVTPVFKKTDYTVTVETPENGTLSVDKTTAQMGDTVTVTATPAEGYKLDSITVNGKAITGNTFTMPAENAVVSAKFTNLPGEAYAEVEAPEGIDVDFSGFKEDVLAAVFGEGYKELVAGGKTLDVVMTVKDETSVPEADKALVEDILSDDMKIGLLLDVELFMTVDTTRTQLSSSLAPIVFTVKVPEAIIAEGRSYYVARVHDGEAAIITEAAAFDSDTNTITVSSDKFSTYAIIYEEKKAEPEPEPEPVPVTVYYSVISDSHSSASTSSAAAGTSVSVRTDFGYDAEVYCGGSRIASLRDGESFTMPSGNVSIISVDNGYFAAMKKALPNSYIFIYDSEMNYIKTNGSTRGIDGKGKITVKLGEEYAGKTVTLYKGRKSTDVKITSKTLNDDGNATFTVGAAMNYTAVVE